MSSTSNSQSSRWSTWLVPPVVASAATIPVSYDFLRKSALQTERPIPPMTWMQSLREGARMGPTAGAIVGMQMAIQSVVERTLVRGSDPTLQTALASSACVGVASAPALAVFNGQTMGRTARESLRQLSPRQACAIAIQETGYVAGLSAADRLAAVMNSQSRAVDYTAAFVSGVAGSLVGHPANTALTRWQSGMTVHPRQWMKGAIPRARAIGIFAVLYKGGKEVLNPNQS